MKYYAEATRKLLPLKSTQTISFVIGNQSCDPDSVIGSLLASIVLTLQSPLNKYILTKQLEPAEESELSELYIPIWASKNLDKILEKDDISHLNKTFNLNLEKFVEIQNLVLANLEHTKIKEQYLYDHNSPEEILKSWLGDRLKPTGIIDHHAIVGGTLQLPSLTNIHLEQSCSAISVLWRTCTEQRIKALLSEHNPDLLAAAAVIIDYDSFGFSPEGKNNRWWAKDLEAVDDIAKITLLDSANRTKLTRDLMDAQYSDNQFKQPLSVLLGRDAKTFSYNLKQGLQENAGAEYKLFYATLPNTAAKYASHFSEEDFKQEVLSKVSPSQGVILLFVCATQETSSREMLLLTHNTLLSTAIGSAVLSHPIPVAETAPFQNPLSSVLQHPSAQSTATRFFVNSSRTLSRKILEKTLRSALEA